MRPVHDSHAKHTGRNPDAIDDAVVVDLASGDIDDKQTVIGAGNEGESPAVISGVLADRIEARHEDLFRRQPCLRSLVDCGKRRIFSVVELIAEAQDLASSR